MKILVVLIFVFLFASVAFPCTVNISNIKTNAIYGKIIDETKEIIPNATIQVYKDTDNGIEILAESKADESGRFEIKNFSPGKYMIRANAKYFAYSFANITLKKSASKVKNKEIIFTLVPEFGCSGWVEVQKNQKTR